MRELGAPLPETGRPVDEMVLAGYVAARTCWRWIVRSDSGAVGGIAVEEREEEDCVHILVRRSGAIQIIAATTRLNVVKLLERYQRPNVITTHAWAPEK
jgi:hypothetical protein